MSDIKTETDKTGQEAAGTEAKQSARFAYDGLDRVLHEKARLGIVTSLIGHPDGLLFGDLRDLCGLTDGNLSRHLQTLETAGIVAIEKGYAGRRPMTRVLLTSDGRARFLAYVAELERVVKDAAKLAKAKSVTTTQPDKRSAAKRPSPRSLPKPA